MKELILTIFLLLPIGLQAEVHEGLYFYNVTSGKLKNLFDNKLMYCIPAPEYFYKTANFKCLTADFEKYKFVQKETNIFLYRKKKLVSNFARILKNDERVRYEVDDLAKGHLYKIDVLDTSVTINHDYKRRLIWTYDRTFNIRNLIPFRIQQMLELRFYKNNKKKERKRIKIYGQKD